MIDILCDDSTSSKEKGDNNDHHRSRRQTFIISVKSMRNSLDHFIYCIVLYNGKTIFSVVALYLALYAQYYEMCQEVH